MIRFCWRLAEILRGRLAACGGLSVRLAGHQTRFRLPSLLVGTTLLLSLPLFADNYPRQPGIDVQHYVLRVALNDDNDEIAGHASVTVRFVKDGLTEFALDLASPKDAGKGMTVTDVSSGDISLRYTQAADRLTIKLQLPSKAGDLRDYDVQYHGIPANGLHILKNKFGERCFFSVNWPVFAREWLPMIDHPSDKATSEFLITAPSRYQVVANGVLVESIDVGDGRRMWHWKQSVPIASWLNNIGVAQFAVRHFATVKGIPLATWVFHQDRDAGIVSLETPMRQAIEFFSESVGPYPYEKLGGVQAAGMGGGMEHASEVFYGQNSIGNRPASSLVWHEVSHQWFGDSVTEKDWDDAWLSEGFATYFASLAQEHFDGHDAFLASMKNKRTQILGMEKRTPGVAVVHDNLPEISGGRAPVRIVYEKGGFTLHMLRGQIGNDKFWAGIREYYRRFRDSNASTADLEKVMEETSGTDLNWFFQQWLYRAGSPTVEGIWSYNAENKKVELDISETQPGDLFRLPIDVAVTTQGSPARIQKIELNAKEQKFEIASDKEPATVELDPNAWLLMDAKLTKK
ncbi:MAG TPA: M1 family metallopeptidase [Verrucomicrobiae bacterium]|nr:M1 family metallopeptidase [Verrucomicrobiae bacterium]